jgi:hypothetical protein
MSNKKTNRVKTAKEIANNEKRYLSIYGAPSNGGRIMPHQYLVELIIERRAEKKGIKLPNCFWRKPQRETYDYWYKIFLHETVYAQRLFRKYDAQCVIDAFNSHDGQKILSANNKSLNKLAKEFQRRKDVLDATREKNKLVVTKTDTGPRKQKGKLNKLSKLKDG